MIQVRLRAADGFELGGAFYEAQRPRVPRRAAVLHGGSGISALHYRRFAQFLAEWGISLLTYDYRGVGLSRPGRLRGFRTSITDWVEYDSAAAIAWLRQRFPEDELIGFSHSIGAFALAAAPNAGDQHRMVFIAPHTAYWGDYLLAYRLPMMVFWHGVMPLITRLVGYFPARSLKLGDDIPADIALEWASRRSPALGMGGAPRETARSARLLDQAKSLDRPALALTISDDAFATVEGARRLLAHFPALKARQVVLSPADAGVPRLGHFGFFRREAGIVLWPRLLTLIESMS